MMGRPWTRATCPRLGFSPYRPQWLAGIRIDPPPSVASAPEPIPAATAAAAPPLDDPVVNSGRQGFRVVPKSGVLTTPRPLLNSETAVLPRITAPAFRNRATGVSSSWGIKLRKSSVPHMQGKL